MNRWFIILVGVLSIVGTVNAEDDQKITKVDIYHSDFSEIVFGSETDTIFAIGHVAFGVGESIIYCDSAVYAVGKYAVLRGNAILDDVDSRVAADSVYYDVEKDDITAMGSYVELWSKKDSLFGVGTHAYYNRPDRYFLMENRPTVYFKFPDTANMIEVIADVVAYDAVKEAAGATGNVVISNEDMSSTAGRAVMHPKQNRLELYEGPVVTRKQSQISGKEIVMTTGDDVIKQIEVIDSARAEFNEPVDSLSEYIDQSILTGRHMVLDFEDGQLDRLHCSGQAYSWYFPSSRGRAEFDENTASGDTILFTIVQDQLEQVEVIGGAIGTYVTGKEEPSDSGMTTTVDTVDYSGEYIRYDILDSLIILRRQAHVMSGAVSLDAEKIDFDTRLRLVEAYSAAILPDTTSNPYELSSIHEPNEIPVRLKDGEDEILGDHLEYSIDTEKGRIVQSKSSYEKGLYYGSDAYRATRKVFYVKNGLYTPCDVNYLHFWADRMKLIEGEKLIARPVIMYVGRIPVVALPYYVFPLRKGRHSGFLPFTVGNLEGGGQRYIRNVGYYWAASDYWDWQGALDYYEQDSRINLYQRLRYKKRYVFDGFLEGNYAGQTRYDTFQGTEYSITSWTLKGAHNHTFSPTFKISATGNYQSSATYYQDFSVNLDDRLNRTTRSQVTFSKRFSNSVALSGSFKHDVNLDEETRTDVLPSMSISVPVIHPFGSGGINEEGQYEEKWYHKLTVRVSSPRFTNYSSRNTIDSVENIVYDTTIVVDTITLEEDTTIALVSADTLKYRSRREYQRLDNGVTVSFPTKIAGYFTFNPSLNYSENWYKINRTDKSIEAGIDADRFYHTYVYGFSTSLRTDIYGTVYPNMFGLLGLRQVITPSLTYSYTPEINEHPEVRQYAGGGAGSARESSSLGISLSHLYQAKVSQGGAERNLDLFSIRHSFNYDFRADTQPWSNLNTSFSSTVLPRINFNGSMTHSFYDPDSGKERFWSPALLNFKVSANLAIGGRNFIFDDPYMVSDTEEDKTGLQGSTQPPSAAPVGSKGWSLSMSYSFEESGRGALYRKSSSLKMSLSFNLTPETAVSYTQYYDIDRGETIHNSVSLTRRLKCWTGVFTWVPIGSTSGYSFRLQVTAIPSIKIDQSSNPLGSGYFQSYMR